MLRVSSIQLETWRAQYHRIRVPRQAALNRYIASVQSKRQRLAAAAATGAKPTDAAAQQKSTSSSSSHITAPSGAPPVEDTKQNPTGTVPHKYNRFFVNESWDFVATQQVVEDPEVSAKRRSTLPEPTDGNLWKNPRDPNFEPFVPFLRIVDYAKDPDSKYMKPTNVPRWKDFMQRKKPTVPRTWY